MSNRIQLSFDDGFKEIELQKDPNRLIRWNPTDINFIDKYLIFQEWASSELIVMLKDLENRKPEITEDGELKFEGYTVGETIEMGELVNSKLDYLFGEGTSKAAFAGANPLSPSSGSPIFGNFVEALMPIIDQSIKENDKAAKRYIDASKGNKKRVKR